jgi:hypothetical protein
LEQAMVERKGDTQYDFAVEEEDVDQRSYGHDEQPSVSEAHQLQQFEPDVEADQPRTGSGP